MRVLTTQSPRVRIEDYRNFIFLKVGLSIHEKINVRNNILVAAKPISDRLLIKN